jgi:protein-tyrosine phosphatase
MMLSRLDELDNAVDIIEATRKAGKNVMSQCWYGRNRSVTLLVAYLMKYEGMDAEEANDLIMETRPEAAPYFDVLQAYYEEYLVDDIE